MLHCVMCILYMHVWIVCVCVCVCVYVLLGNVYNSACILSHHLTKPKLNLWATTITMAANALLL